jgi:hypothetical protein
MPFEQSKVNYHFVTYRLQLVQISDWEFQSIILKILWVKYFRLVNALSAFQKIKNQSLRIHQEAEAYVVAIIR